MLRRWKFRNEAVLLVLILVAIQFFPKRMNAGAYGLGVVQGSLLAIQAICIVLVYRTNRIINFAQVQIGATAAACFAVLVEFQWLPHMLHTVCPPCASAMRQTSGLGYEINYWVALVLSLGLAVLLGWFVYLVLVRLFGNAPRLIVTVASLFAAQALPLVSQRLLKWSLTDEEELKGVPLPTAPVELPFDFTFRVSGVLFHAVDVIIVAVAVLSAVGLYLYLRLSATGTAIRASSENPSRASTLGVNVSGVTTRVWLFVGAVSGFAGVLTATKQGPTVGGLDTGTLVEVLFIAVVARFSNLPVALVGALVLGVLQQGVLWSFGSLSPLYGSLVLLVGVALVLQRDQLSRAELDQASAFQAARELRGIPRELRNLPVVRKWVRIGLVLVVAVLGTYPWIVSLNLLGFGSVAVLYAMVGLSLLVLTGWTGQISLGQFAFAAVGAWVAAASGLPFVLGVPAGAIAGGLVALVVGIPALRLHGLQLAVMSLAFALAVRFVLVDPKYGGKYVEKGVDSPRLFGLTLGPEAFYYVTLGALGLAVLAVLGLRRGRLGRVLIAARDNEGTTRSAGVAVTRARLTAFGVSGFIAALAGGLFAYSQHTVNANDFSPNASLDVFLYAVIGGLGAVAGPLLGGLYQWAMLALGDSETLRTLFTGVGGLALLLVCPGGLAAGLAGARDAALRRVASRNRILVPSLMSDRPEGRQSDKAPIVAFRGGRGRTAFVPHRFRLRRQWVLGVTDAIVAPGATGGHRNGFVDSKPAGFGGLAKDEAPTAAHVVTTRPVEDTRAKVDGEWQLRPSAREEQLGVTAQELTLPEPEEEGEKFSVRGHVAAWLRSADPRGIEGPKLPLMVLSAAAFVNAWDDAALLIVMPNLMASFGVDLQFLVAIGGTMAIIGTLLAIPMGFLADRIRRVRLMQASMVLACVAMLSQALATTTYHLALSRVAAGAAFAVGAPVGISLFADWYATSSRSRVFAFHTLSARLGDVVAPSVAGVLVISYGWRGAFIFLVVLAVIAQAGVFFLREPKRGYLDRLEAGASAEQAATPQPALGLGESFRTAFGIVTMRRLMYAKPFQTMTYAGFPLIVVTYYIYLFHLGTVWVAQVLTLSTVAAMVGLVFSGPVSDRLLASGRPGRVVTLLGMATLLQALAVAVMAFSPWLWLSVLINLPVAAVAALFLPATTVVFSMVVPARMRGVGMQMGAPFQLAGIVIMLSIMPFLLSDLRRGMLIFAVIIAIPGFFTLSAAAGVDRDMRAARAANLAQDDTDAAAAAGQQKMVVCRDVDVTYDGVQVLFNVDFDVEEGEIVALLGTNGAGKSTLMRAIAGIQQASNGAIFLDGRDITAAPPHENAQRGLVVMPGGAAVFPTMTVDDNLRTAAWMYREDESYLAERLEAVFEFFPILRERRYQLAGNLSGGEQQMVGLGQALLMRPRLLMIDELSLGLAPKVVEQLLDTLRAIHAQGTTIILVEQSLNVAITIAQRAVFMDKGEIQFSGAVAELMRRPDLIRAVFMGGGTGAGVRRGRATARPPELERAAPLLSVERVGVSFGGVKALHEVTLDVGHGELVGVIGPNGAGKTTLFDVISGFVRPDAGVIRFADEDVTRMSPDGRARMGLTRSFQNARLFPSLTVRENISVFLERRAMKSALVGALWLPMERRAEERISARVDDLIDLLGLGAYAEKFVRELSTGTRRAVDMACVMAAEPKLLLLDEPSSGLAQAETEELGPVLARVAHDTGCGMLVIEHDLPLITSVSERLVAMELGTVIAAGPTQDVMTDQRVLTSYLSASESVLARSDTMGAVAEAIGAVPTGVS